MKGGRREEENYLFLLKISSFERLHASYLWFARVAYYSNIADRPSRVEAAEVAVALKAVLVGEALSGAACRTSCTLMLVLASSSRMARKQTGENNGCHSSMARTRLLCF